MRRKDQPTRSEGLVGCVIHDGLFLLLFWSGLTYSGGGLFCFSVGQCFIFVSMIR